MADKDRYVEVVPVSGGFELIENGRGTQELRFSKNHDRIDKKKMKKKDDYRIFFFLDERGAYTFEANKAKVMLINGQSCPYPAHDPEFEVDEVDDYVLEVINRDRQPQQYKFTLNLLDSNKTPVVYDPIMSNRNGGI